MATVLDELSDEIEEKRNSDGFLSLWDVYESLGVELDPIKNYEMRNVGWTKGQKGMVRRKLAFNIVNVHFEYESYTK